MLATLRFGACYAAGATQHSLAASSIQSQTGAEGRGLICVVLAVQNAGSKYAGSITAALFLQQYVDTEKVQWAHIDIAGCELASHGLMPHSTSTMLPLSTAREQHSLCHGADSVECSFESQARCHLHADVACSTAWDDKLGGATGYGAALLAQWAILEGEGQP